ncbi:DUF4142 domain-containing protein [Ramlibacter tataouinensis]|uniref:DUF4142 domain-containing protein n=1 Tax=Ramlibacter tataouinensis (strain ATCC BAA-407 / DSM 14655 / LMG 21543 / TTB310) TaxID=365046 RepID=F5Y2L8_RAMTT|nr:DUF4142 domain-containing protein [Ramlibacter tataouinensis]AEG92381.1 conserved hypothetical protein [Ramlibacter tataouinensis TTB310]
MNFAPPSSRPSTLLALAAAAALALATGCSSVDLGGGSGTATAGAPGAGAAALGMQDRVFALQAAAGGMYEVQAGQLAAARAADPQVQAFGRMLVDHHTLSNNELLSLLQARGLAAPAALPPQLQAKLARLQGLNGPEFDREFIRNAGLLDHQVQITLAEQASRDAVDPALRAWFAKNLPVLRQHLGAAQAVAGSMAG